MSFIALATNQFEAVAEFYEEMLGLPVVDQWDRARGRGRRFDLGGMQLEILDNQRVPEPMNLGPSRNSVHVVVEVSDIDDSHTQLRERGNKPPAVEDTSWGARLFRLNDPDGVAVTFLQWT
ncbi:VOC family protein [Microbulbifer agarilyticus]|uniref:VOC family protein n=1 Tax=Microbulbifer agarilyticus TaxID=260552 RepID=UPI001C966078|nr:VOC family protein [Microbulbifer agarilyticus]MBY6190352.1 VOC family protein [Microbulbifer agarilyticus]